MNQMSDIDIDWPTVKANLDKIESIKMRETRADLLKGACAMLFSSVLGTVFLMLIIMTPDPDGLINYKGAGAILIILFLIFIYSIKKLDIVDNFLKKKGS
jgi:hypothetical protein